MKATPAVEHSSISSFLSWGEGAIIFIMHKRLQTEEFFHKTTPIWKKQKASEVGIPVPLVLYHHGKQRLWKKRSGGAGFRTRWKRGWWQWTQGSVGRYVVSSHWIQEALLELGIAVFRSPRSTIDPILFHESSMSCYLSEKKLDSAFAFLLFPYLVSRSGYFVLFF